LLLRSSVFESYRHTAPPFEGALCTPLATTERL